MLINQTTNKKEKMARILKEVIALSSFSLLITGCGQNAMEDALANRLNKSAESLDYKTFTERSYTPEKQFMDFSDYKEICDKDGKVVGISMVSTSSRMPDIREKLRVKDIHAPEWANQSGMKWVPEEAAKLEGIDERWIAIDAEGDLSRKPQILAIDGNDCIRLVVCASGESDPLMVWELTRKSTKRNPVTPELSWLNCVQDDKFREKLKDEIIERIMKDKPVNSDVMARVLKWQLPDEKKGAYIRTYIDIVTKTAIEESMSGDARDEMIREVSKYWRNKFDKALSESKGNAANKDAIWILNCRGDFMLDPDAYLSAYVYAPYFNDHTITGNEWEHAFGVMEKAGRADELRKAINDVALKSWESFMAQFDGKRPTDLQLENAIAKAKGMYVVVPNAVVFDVDKDFREKPYAIVDVPNAYHKEDYANMQVQVFLLGDEFLQLTSPNAAKAASLAKGDKVKIFGYIKPEDVAVLVLKGVVSK